MLQNFLLLTIAFGVLNFVYKDLLHTRVYWIAVGHLIRSRQLIALFIFVFGLTPWVMTFRLLMELEERLFPRLR